MSPTGAGGTFRLPDPASTEPRCVYPGCQNTRRTRGNCHGHYQNMRSAVRRGKVTEADLESRGFLLPKGTGGCGPCGDTVGAFKTGGPRNGSTQ